MRIKFPILCYQREIFLRDAHSNFQLNENQVVPMGELFLLRETLRKVYLINKKLNEVYNQNEFQLNIFSRFSEIYNFEIDENEENQVVSNILFGMHAGFVLVRLYSKFEILRYHKLTNDDNPYFMATRCIERLGGIGSDRNTKNFEIHGTWGTPYKLTYYSDEIPYIIDTSDAYLDAINNYYKQHNTTDYEKYQPQWLLDDNLRGVISDEYKKWV